MEYSGGETSTLCQLEVSVWPCVCSTGCSRLVTHPGTNPRSTVLDFGDLTGTGMSPPLGCRQECSRMIRTQFRVETPISIRTLTTALRRSVYTKKKKNCDIKKSTPSAYQIWFEQVRTSPDTHESCELLVVFTCIGITLSFSLFFSSLVIVRSSSYEPDVKRFFCRSERSLRVGLSKFLSQFLTNISGTGESK